MYKKHSSFNQMNEKLKSFWFLKLLAEFDKKNK